MTPVAIALIVGICLFVFLVIVPIYNIPSHIRAKRIARVAQQFGLSFSKGTSNLFNPFQSYRSKTNVISGTLNGRAIEAFDNQRMLAMPIGPEIVGSFRKWVLTVDGVRQPVLYAGRFFGVRIPVHKIQEFLSTIS